MNINRIKLCREATVPYGGERINESAQAARIIRELTRDAAEESFYAFALDVKNVIQSIHLVAMGGGTEVSLSPADVFRGCLLANGHGLIVAHNHPSGVPGPSREDRELTQRLKDGCELLGLRFVDHVIVVDTGHYSFADAR